MEDLSVRAKKLVEALMNDEKFYCRKINGFNEDKEECVNFDFLQKLRYIASYPDLITCDRLK